MRGRNVRGSIFVLLGAVFLGQYGAHAQPAGRTDEAPGEKIYRSFCASCHGPYGRGNGPLAESVAAPIPDFTSSPVFTNRSDEEIVAALRGAPLERHGSMAIARVFEEDALRDAIAYARTLSVPGGHVSVLAGRDIYNSSCWVCHGREGNGKGPALQGTGAQARDFTSQEFVIEGREEELSRIIALGAAKAFHGSPYMIDWANRLTPQQIRDVVEFLKTFKDSGS